MFSKTFKTIKQAGLQSYRDQVPLYASSIAFYMLFALVPTFFILSFIGSYVFEGDTIRGTLFFYIDRYIGHDTVTYIQSTSAPFRVADASVSHGQNIFYLTISIVLIVYLATIIFSSLHDAFEKIVGAKVPLKGIISGYILKRFIGLLFIIFFTIVLFSLNFLNNILDIFQKNIITFFGPDFSWLSSSTIFIESLAVTFIVVTILFSLAYKVFSYGIINARQAIYGGIYGAICFIIITSLVRLYFTYTNLSDEYGFASSVVATLLWTYYIVQGFLFGLEVSKYVSRINDKSSPSGII